MQRLWPSHLRPAADANSPQLSHKRARSAVPRSGLGLRSMLHLELSPSNDPCEERGPPATIIPDSCCVPPQTQPQPSGRFTRSMKSVGNLGTGRARKMHALMVYGRSGARHLGIKTMYSIKTGCIRARSHPSSWSLVKRVGVGAPFHRSKRGSN